MRFVHIRKHKDRYVVCLHVALAAAFIWTRSPSLCLFIFHTLMHLYQPTRPEFFICSELLHFPFPSSHPPFPSRSFPFLFVLLYFTFILSHWFAPTFHPFIPFLTRTSVYTATFLPSCLSHHSLHPLPLPLCHFFPLLPLYHFYPSPLNPIFHSLLSSFTDTFHTFSQKKKLIIN